MIVGGVSLEAVPAAREDDAETASIIVNGRKGLYEHGHSGGPAVPVRCLGFVLGGKVQGSSARAHNLEASYQRLRRPQSLS